MQVLQGHTLWHTPCCPDPCFVLCGLLAAACLNSEQETCSGPQQQQTYHPPPHPTPPLQSFCSVHFLCLALCSLSENRAGSAAAPSSSSRHISSPTAPAHQQRQQYPPPSGSSSASHSLAAEPRRVCACLCGFGRHHCQQRSDSSIGIVCTPE